MGIIRKIIREVRHRQRLFRDLASAFPPALNAYFEASRLIRAERARQIGLGFDSVHDDAHVHGEIAMAAAHFAMSPWASEELYLWPWRRNQDHKSQKSRLQQLVIAAALLHAEIERRLRAGERP